MLEPNPRVMEVWDHVVDVLRKAVIDLKSAFDAGKIAEPLTNPLYFNIRRMQEARVA